MPKTFKDLMSELATDTSENAIPTEDIQGIIDEVTAKDTRIQELTEALEKANKQHEDLKNRIVDKLFSENNGKTNESDDNSQEESEEDDQTLVTFDDLINPEYRIRN